MRFTDIDNIWAVDVEALSNADRCRLYFERAKQVVANATSDPAERRRAVKDRRFQRAYLIEKIGCGPAVMVQNPRIKKLLADTDLLLHDPSDPLNCRGHGTAVRDEQLSQPSKRVGLQSRLPGDKLAAGLIVATDANCNIKGRSWSDIPTLVWPEGVDEAASDWFRFLVVVSDVSTSSAKEYAKILRPFLRFCRQRCRRWQSADDDLLITWREHLKNVEKVNVDRVNASLKTIFAFYRWAEEVGVLRFQVGIYTENNIAESMKKPSFAITAKRVFSKGKNGRTYESWTTPLTLSGSKQNSPTRHTPTEDEIRRHHEVAIEREHGERDSLMFSWAEEAGPRRSEFLRVCKSHLPSPIELADLIERDEPWMVHVKRKGGSIKPLNVTPELIIRTLDYIEFDRREVVDRCRESIVGYCEPDEVFLSGKTGMPLHPDSVTSIGRRSFRKAGINRASIHRLRARFAIRTIETLVDAVFGEDSKIGADSSWIETILVKAAEMMGQASPQSLRPYLNYVLNRRIQSADATKAGRLAARLRQLQLQERTVVRRLAHIRELHEAARLIQEGRGSVAASVLEELASSLR